MVIGMEECAEIAQRLSKALRFGMEQVQAEAGHAVTGDPDELLTNRERIRKEFSDLASVLEMVGIGAPLGKWMDEKREKVERFLTYSAEVGTLGQADAGTPTLADAVEISSGGPRATESDPASPSAGRRERGR